MNSSLDTTNDAKERKERHTLYVDTVIESAERRIKDTPTPEMGAAIIAQLVKTIGMSIIDNPRLKRVIDSIFAIPEWKEWSQKHNKSVFAPGFEALHDGSSAPAIAFALLDMVPGAELSHDDIAVLSHMNSIDKYHLMRIEDIRRERHYNAHGAKLAMDDLLYSDDTRRFVEDDALLIMVAGRSGRDGIAIDWMRLRKRLLAVSPNADLPWVRTALSAVSHLETEERRVNNNNNKRVKYDY